MFWLLSLCIRTQREPWNRPGLDALRSMCHKVFQVRVHGCWDPMCLPVPERPITPSSSEVFGPLCVFPYAPLVVKEA